MRCATIDLSKRSAISPPRPDRKKNGAMNTAAVSVFSEPALGRFGANRIMKPSELLRKLSLKALKNWHQNSGAKRRVVMRLVDMGALWALAPLPKIPDCDGGRTDRGTSMTQHNL